MEARPRQRPTAHDMFFTAKAETGTTLSPPLPNATASIRTQDLDFDPPPHVAPVPAESIGQLMDANKAQTEARARKERVKAELMRVQKGFCEEGAEGDNY